MNVVLNYLTFDLKHIGPALENAKMKEDYTIKIIEATEEEENVSQEKSMMDQPKCLAKCVITHRFS